jgi:hypothetical protein
VHILAAAAAASEPDYEMVCRPYMPVGSRAWARLARLHCIEVEQGFAAATGRRSTRESGHRRLHSKPAACLDRVSPAPQAMMVHECLPQDAPLAGGKAYDTWATKIYEELSGAPDSALFCGSLLPVLAGAAATLCLVSNAAGGGTVIQLASLGSEKWHERQKVITMGSCQSCIDSRPDSQIPDHRSTVLLS